LEQNRTICKARGRGGSLWGSKWKTGGVGLGATLEGVRDDGIVLLEIGELGPGPTMFRPWDSPKRYSGWLPWLVRNTRSPNRAIGQRQTAGEVMVTLTSLELYEEGLGVLRYLVYYEEDMFEGCYRIANPELVVRMCLAANCPGQYEALAAVQAKRTATWRFATCRRRES
jgi:hypothetical protein